MKKLATVGLAALAVFAIGCGISNKEPIVTDGPTANHAQEAIENTKVLEVNKTATVEINSFGIKYKAEYTVSELKQYTQAPQMGDFKPEKGVFLSFKINAKNISGQVSVCSCYFVVVDQTGTVYKNSFIPGFNDTLSADTLNVGQQVTGLVVFDVPKTVVPGSSVELRSVLDDPIVHWTF